MESEGRKIHGLAEQAREEGDFLKALKLTDESMIAYQQAKDTLGFAEIQASRFLVLRHLYEQTADRHYLVLAKHAALAAVEIAENTDNKQALAIPYFNLAKAQETLGEFSDAVTSYQKALEHMLNNPPTEHHRPAVVADMRVHLTTCEYKAGDKTAFERALTATAELEQAEEISDYNKNVWLSGAHMRIAEMLRADQPTRAKEHLQKAKDIIDADQRLELRGKQWGKLAETFE